MALQSKNQSPEVAQLTESIRFIANLCEQIDSGADIDQFIQAEFAQAKLNLSDAVGRTVLRLDGLEAAISHSKENRDAWAARAQSLERVYDKIKAATLEAVKAAGDVACISKHGKLSVQKSTPALQLDVKTKTTTVRHVVDLDDGHAPAIDQKYLTRQEIFSLNTEEIKADLAQGIEIPWARMTRGEHLRWRML